MSIVRLCPAFIPPATDARYVSTAPSLSSESSFWNETEYTLHAVISDASPLS